MYTLTGMFRTLLAGIRALVLLPVFFLLTVVSATFVVVYGAFRPAAPIHDKIIKMWSGAWLMLPPVRLDVEGTAKVDPKQRYVVVSNHLSMFDIPTLIRVLPLHGRFLAKKEVFDVPLMGRAMRTMGIIEINREQGRSTRAAINEGVRVAAERGYSLLVFPEGTRGTGTDFLPFKNGAFRIAIDTGLPLLPVVIEGTDRVSKPGSKLFYPGRASIRVLDPIDTAGMTNEDDLSNLLDQVFSSMRDVYSDLRQEEND